MRIFPQPCNFSSVLFYSTVIFLYYILGGVNHMKSKYGWFDDNWNPDANPITVILELLLSPTYRIPLTVTEIHIYRDRSSYPLCPRCKSTLAREYQRFCDRCGQRLSWYQFDDAKEVYIGWNEVNGVYLP